MKEQYAEQAKNTEQFFKELNSEKVKFNVIAEYFGRGLFSDIDAHLQNEWTNEVKLFNQFDS